MSKGPLSATGGAVLAAISIGLGLLQIPQVNRWVFNEPGPDQRMQTISAPIPPSVSNEPSDRTARAGNQPGQPPAQIDRGVPREALKIGAPSAPVTLAPRDDAAGVTAVTQAPGLQMESVRFDFSDSGRWPLSESLRLSSGKLAVTVDSNEWAWIPIPGVESSPNFSLQAEMTLIEGHFCFSAYGFGLGLSETESSTFLAQGDCGESGRITFFSNRGVTIDGPSEMKLMRKRQPYQMRLDVRGREVTLSVDGKKTETSLIERSGKIVALVARRVSDRFVPRHSTFTFDNVVYRPEP